MSDASVREECAAILEMPVANQVPRDTVRRLARAHLELLDKSQWQPIETAPKDEEWVMLLDDPELIPVFALWDEDAGEWITAGTRKVVHPTHWMPLPDPPEAK